MCIRDRPCIVSEIRGNQDLIKDGVNGFLINSSKCNDLKNIINMIMQERDAMSNYNINKSKDYCDYVISDLMLEIYKGVCLLYTSRCV